jgi:DNA repair/transcription protein MET18/MMS19
MSLMTSSIEGSKLPPNQVGTIIWLSKALVLRLAPDTTKILTSLLDLLASPDAETSFKAARGFGLLLAGDNILSSKNGATIRLLAQQKIFTTVVPLIATRVREFNATAAASSAGAAPALPNHVKQACLTALSGILSTVPSRLVAPELPTLFPLLLQSLDLTGPDSQPIKSRTLDVLAVIIRENGVRTVNMLGYVDDLVNRLLKCANTNAAAGGRGGDGVVVGSSKNNPTTRAKALQCLLLLAQHPAAPDVELTASEKAQASPLLRLKPAVLRSLKLILDDPKRDVRKAAVDARAAWLRSVEDGKTDDE